MKNYKVKIDMGYKITEISIRGESQKDVDEYVSVNLDSLEFIRVNPNLNSKVIFKGA